MFPARIGPAGADVARLLGALLGALLGDGDALSITGATRGRGEGGREGGKDGEGRRRKRGGGRSGSRHRDAPRRAGLRGEPEDGAVPRLRAGQAVRSCLGLAAEDGDVKRQNWEGGAARTGAAKGDHKTSQGGLKDARSGPAAVEVPRAPYGTERGRELCSLQGKAGRNTTQCLEWLEG